MGRRRPGFRGALILDLCQAPLVISLYNNLLIFGTGGLAVFNVIALAVIVLAVVALGSGIIWAIGNNLRQGERYRQELGERLAQLRLQTALKWFGTDPGSYLHTQPIVDIEGQMRRCSTCEETVRCDVSLERNRPSEEFAFCPNYPELEKLVQ